MHPFDTSSSLNSEPMLKMFSVFNFSNPLECTKNSLIFLNFIKFNIGEYMNVFVQDRYYKTLTFEICNSTYTNQQVNFIQKNQTLKKSVQYFRRRSEPTNLKLYFIR
jgi:hypothetical protein